MHTAKVHSDPELQPDHSASATTTKGAGPHLERGVARCRRGTKREAVVIGALTVERIVNGQYEWRDAGYAALKGTRKRLWDAWHA